MPKINLDPSAESFLKGIQNRKAKHDAAITGDVPKVPHVVDEKTKPASTAQAAASVTQAPEKKATAEKPKVKKPTQEALIARTFRIFPSQLRAMKQRAIEVGGPDEDKQISEIIRTAIDLYLTTK